MRNRSTFLIILICALILLFQGQGCSSGTRFSLHELAGFKSQISGGANGNGTGYDGKLRVFHHYVDGFTCEGLPRPESIITRNKNLEWSLIRNTPEKCAADRIPAQGVQYIEGQLYADFQNVRYVPPRDYIVDASENPNLPGLKTDLGICQDQNGKCSLLAAFDQAGLTSLTAPVKIQIPAGKYTLTTPLWMFSQYSNTNSISILGQDAATTIIDGNGNMGGLMMGNLRAAPVLISKLTFQNMVQAISVSDGLGAIDIDNSIFKNNGVAALEASGTNKALMPTALSIRNSQFSKNGAVAIHTQGNFKVLIEDTSIDQTSSKGIWSSAAPEFIVRRTTVSRNGGRGITLENCLSCLIENTTVTGNFGGLDISTDPQTPPWQVIIQNSTIVANTTLGSQNILLNISDSPYKVVLRNSIIATNDSSINNCNSSYSSNFGLVSTNNLFDFASCGVLDSTNIVNSNLLLGPLANNGGVTLTMGPLQGSPAIDAGENSFCAFADQRGLKRPIDHLGSGPRCDIGAVEVQ